MIQPYREDGFTTLVKVMAAVGLAFALLLTLCGSSAHGADRIVQSGQSVQATVNAAANGDVIILADGQHAGGIDFGSKSLTLKAANRGKAVVTGGRITGGQQVKLDGFVFTGGAGNYMVGAVQIGGGEIVNCEIVKAEASGVFLNSNTTIRDSRVAECGYAGIEGLPTDKFVNGRVIGCVVEFNNCGRSAKPSWADRVEGGYRFGVAKDFQLRLVDGNLQPVKDGKTYWYGAPAWHAGGMKFGYTRAGLMIENNLVRFNGGCGIWLDCYVVGAIVRGNESHGHAGISAAWEGPGGWDEICTGPNTWENNYFHDNAGGGLVLMETTGSIVRNNVFSANGIGFRDMTNRTPGLKNIQLIDNRFYGAQTTANIAAAPAGRNISQSGTKLNLAMPVQWTRPGAAAPPATVPASEILTDAAGVKWQLAGGKVIRNGVTDQVTSGVMKIVVGSDGALYQQAASGWWKAGAAIGQWTAVTGPATQPATQPTTVPAPVPTKTIVEVKDIGGLRKIQIYWSDGSHEIREVPIP